MTSIGERLREERVRRGLTIEQVAGQTKIHASMLEAIETENFDLLPGGFFARSFIRQYARALGVDEAEIEPELQRLTGSEPAPVAQAENGFRPEMNIRPLALSYNRRRSRQPLGALIAFLLIVAACSAIYALWERTRQAASTPEPLEKTAQQQPPPAQVQQPVQTAAQPPAQQAAPEPVQPSTDQPTEPVKTPEPQPQATTAAAAQQTAPVQVDVRARAEVWIRAVSEGKTQFEGTLQENETRAFTGNSLVVLRFGRPAAVEVTWNGKPTGPLRPVENPLSVEFTPETFRILTPATPPAVAP